MLFGSSCAISGTGFLVSSALIDELGGWPYHLLTEDIQFSVEQVLRGKRIGYAEKAMLYDEQPIDFATSWRQRLRWAKGFYQVLQCYGTRLLRSIFKRKGFSSYDLLMTIAPAFVLTLFLWFFNTSFLIFAMIEENPLFIRIALNSMGSGLLGAYFSLFFHGAVATVFQWKKIRASTWKKLLYMFTFPIFLFTYIPISWAALFKKVTWEPIKHIITERVA
jgi:cellulose synthase/poly-beta-1,6-N-acetylglucosamine synthase-like glycosyltransferase